MKNIQYLVFAFALMLCSCSKEAEDEVIPEIVEEIEILQSVSGSVFLDDDGDGTGDTAMEGGYVYLGDPTYTVEIFGQNPDTLEAPYNEINFTIVDADGNYSFDNLPIMENQLIAAYNPFDVAANTVGVDNTPDGDFIEDDPFVVINVSLDVGEHDDGNDFVITLKVFSTISGYINNDDDQDGTLDGPLTNAKLWLSRRSDGGTPIGLALDNVFTDENGYYEFVDVSPGKYSVTFADVVDHRVMSSGDDSPDSDHISTWKDWVSVDLIEGEVDTDNNFNVEPNTWYQIAGSVLLDTDLDGTGDMPIGGQVIEVYKRDDDLNPIGDRVGWNNVGSNGTFSFTFLYEGKYILKIVDNQFYNCASSSDQTMEVGEPAGNNCSFIPIDLFVSKSQDADNVFILTNI